MTQDNTRYPVKKFVRMTSEMAALIDKCRYDERLPSENETIRRALTLGLAALGGADAAPPVPDAPEPLLSDEMAERVAKCRDVKQHRSENETIRWLLKAALDGFDKQQAAKG